MRDVDPVELLEALCAVPSPSGDEAAAAEMHAAVAARLAALGAEISDEALPGGPCALIGRRRPERALQVLFLAHGDVSYGSEHPVRGTVRSGDRLIGPGTADMKGGIAVALTALAAFEAHPSADGLGWTLLMVPDGASAAVRSEMLIRSEARRASVAFVMNRAGEGGELIRRRLGLTGLRMVADGRAAAAGFDPDRGRNAVVALADLVTAVAALDDPSRGVLVNVSRIGGGGAQDTVPGFAVAEVEVRARRPAQHRALPERIGALAADVARRRDVGMAVEIHREVAPLVEQDGREVLIAAMRDIGSPLGLALGPGCESAESPLASLVADEGTVVLDGVGVVGGGSRSTDEHCVIASLGQRGSLLAGLLARLATAELWLPEWRYPSG